MEAFDQNDQSNIVSRTKELSAKHREYVANHPELTELLHDWLTNCLVNKPDDCYQFCREYFQGFQGGDGTGERDFKDGWGYRECRALIIIGPSGAGKRWLAKKLVGQYEDRFGVVVAHTSRPPREGEVDGVDYVFTSQEAMDLANNSESGDFLAHQQSDGYTYAISKDRLAKVAGNGRVALICCDVPGGINLRKELIGTLQPRVLFIKPPEVELKRRVRSYHPSLPDAEVAARTKTEEQINDQYMMFRTFVDKMEPAEYSIEDKGMAFGSSSWEDVDSWIMKESWLIQKDPESKSAATAIQRQARRKRDAKRVEEIRVEKQRVLLAPPEPEGDGEGAGEGEGEGE
eukprot:CAMPEP_0180296022 /NCGR_PEP_ID=MMETSP0988-20121125/19368_1 /TAXON_ID=697907 /ORGANISM="non described non described, Strain CCMP2293" /LENGTH=344 /DNA_ID=CAMNT_0022273755 /DNA_START=63 /DNA_END=1094 /DNA_ORIENTATION=+